jgi:hypothetical protein
MYTIAAGKLDEFVKGWREAIYPLRLKFGFKVDGAWVVKEDNKFIWILTYDGAGDWDAVNKAYHESPERRALNPDPAPHIVHIEERFITSVMPQPQPEKETPQDTRLQHVRQLISQRQHKAAHEILLGYLKDHPRNADAWFLMGQSASDNAEARAALQNALELDPEHKDASVLLASLKGEAEIITYPTRPDVDLETLAARRKAEREAKENEEKPE